MLASMLDRKQEIKVANFYASIRLALESYRVDTSGKETSEILEVS